MQWFSRNLCSIGVGGWGQSAMMTKVYEDSTICATALV